MMSLESLQWIILVRDIPIAKFYTLGMQIIFKECLVIHFAKKKLWKVVTS